MIKVLMICHGNICRSPMAEFILKDMVKKKGMENSFLIASCATSREEIGNSLHPGARAKLDEMGIPHKKRAAVQLTKEDYTTYDYLLCMDQWNINNVKRIIGHDPKHKVHLLLEYAGVKRDIADPWYTGCFVFISMRNTYTGNFDVTYDDIVQGCEAFLEELGV